MHGFSLRIVFAMLATNLQAAWAGWFNGCDKSHTSGRDFFTVDGDATSTRNLFLQACKIETDQGTCWYPPAGVPLDAAWEGFDDYFDIFFHLSDYDWPDRCDLFWVPIRVLDPHASNDGKIVIRACLVNKAQFGCGIGTEMVLRVDTSSWYSSKDAFFKQTALGNCGSWSLNNYDFWCTSNEVLNAVSAFDGCASCSYDSIGQSTYTNAGYMPIWEPLLGQCPFKKEASCNKCCSFDENRRIDTTCCDSRRFLKPPANLEETFVLNTCEPRVKNLYKKHFDENSEMHPKGMSPFLPLNVAEDDAVKRASSSSTSSGSDPGTVLNIPVLLGIVVMCSMAVAFVIIGGWMYKKSLYEGSKGGSEEGEEEEEPATRAKVIVLEDGKK